MFYSLTDRPSIAHTFLNELRDVSVQRDRLRFRLNLERIGELLAYEISRSLTYQDCQIDTPLDVHHCRELYDRVVLTTILRAGLPMYQGFLRLFDRAESAFVGAFRGPTKPDFSFEIDMGYLTSPSLEGCTLILIDPMLATGKSLVKTVEALKDHGTPASIHVACAIASKQGAAYVQEKLENCKIWAGAVDPTLNDHFYIVPGLGDAGDLAFGKKE